MNIGGLQLEVFQSTCQRACSPMKLQLNCSMSNPVSSTILEFKVSIHYFLVRFMKIPI